MKTQTYTRKRLDVDAVQVSAENMEEVAEWCGGSIKGDGTTKHIKVNINRPLSERQTKAFVGDWVLHSVTGFRIYTPKAFENGFQLVKTGDPKPEREVKITVGEPLVEGA